MRRFRYRCLDRPQAAALAFALALALAVVAAGQTKPGRQSDGSTILPSGQRITPSGDQVVLPSLPMSLEQTRDGKFLLVLAAGFEKPSISLINLESREVTQRVELDDAWLGLTQNRRGDKVFVSGGARGSVYELSYKEGSLKLVREFPVLLEGQRSPTLIGDVRFDPDDRLLYAADVLRNTVTVINSQSGIVLGDFETGAAPYRIRVAPDGGHLLISHWAESSIGFYRLSDRRLVERISVGERPTDIVVLPGEVEVVDPEQPDGSTEKYSSRIFVACAFTDTLWSIGITDRGRFAPVEALPLGPRPDSPLGSMPTALALSADNSRLYIANSGNNAILVAETAEAFIEFTGALPTGWFPTAISSLENGGLAYLSGKGDSDNGGLAGLLPPLNQDQLDFLTGASLRNVPEPVTVDQAIPGTVKRIALIFSDAQGPRRDDIAGRYTRLSGLAAAGRSPLGQLGWLSSAVETDFFAKLGPAIEAGRLNVPSGLTPDRLAAGPVGTLWSNASDAALTTKTYGLPGGDPSSAFDASEIAELTAIHLNGSPAEQDVALGNLFEKLETSPLFAETAIFVLPLDDAAPEGIVAGGAALRKQVRGEFASTPSLVRTIGWLLGLNPLTQFDSSATIIPELFKDE